MALISADVVHYDNGANFYTNVKQTVDQQRRIDFGVWGSYIPLSEGYRAIPGAIIWAGTPFRSDERSQTMYIGDGGLHTITNTTWSVKRPCAFAFGYRLNPNGQRPKVRRVWVDGSLAYSEGTSAPAYYSNFNQIYLPAGQYVNGVWVPNDPSNTEGYLGDSKGILNQGGGFTATDPNTGRFLGQVPLSSTINFRFYAGTEDQTPDQALVKELGSDAPAFRGMMYLVIDDVIVGQGSSNEQAFWPGTNVNGPTKVGNQIVLPNFPSIRVELADGGETVVYSELMLDLDGSPAYERNSTPVAPNWGEGQIATIQQHSDGGGVIHIYDMDTKAEVAHAECDTTVYGRICESLLIWNPYHNWFWTDTLFSTDGHCDVTVDTKGHVISPGMIVSFGNLTFSAANGNPVTDDNPADRCTTFVAVDLGYAIVNGEYEVILFGAGSNGHGCSRHIEQDGTQPHIAYPRELIDVPSGHTTTDQIIALPLWKHATTDQHLTYQDCAFLQCIGSVHDSIPGMARLVFIGIDGDGTTRIKGTQDLFHGAFNGTSIRAMMDVDGNLLLQESDDEIHKFTIDYLGEPDYSIAPGWRGLFPRIKAQVTKTYATGGGFNMEKGYPANVNGNTVYYQGKILNLGTMEVTTIPALTGGGLWDGDRNLFYWVFGGMRWTQIISGLSGVIYPLSSVLKDIALAAGYTLDDLNVDSALTAGVPGVYITSPTDLGSLFNNMGAIYEFSYFNSGGTLTFRGSTNTPVYATGYVLVVPSSPPQDGDTLTIGTVTYRFKNTPSAPFDVKLVADTSALIQDGAVQTLANLYAAIKGDSTIGKSTPPFYAGTVVNPTVTVKPDAVNNMTNYGYAKLLLTAAVGGTAGNSVTLSSSTGRVAVSGGGHLSGGQEPPAPSISITLDNLCLVGENQITDTDALVTSIPPPGQSQQAAQVSYYALEQDYKPLSQTFTPDNLGGALPDSTSTVTYALPIVMSTSEAYARVSRVAIAGGEMLITQEFRLPQAYLSLEPNDVVGITIAPFQYIVRVDEATFNGDFSMSVSATNFTARTDIPVNDSDSRANVPQTIPNAGDASPLFIDAPVLDVRQGTFAGNMEFLLGVRPLYTSVNSATFSWGPAGQDLTQLYTTSSVVKWGKLSAAMPAFVYPGYAIVEDSITIVCKSLDFDRDLQNATDELSFIAGENCVAIGRPGNWEYVFFRDVEQLGSKTVKLTGLIRAQRGTDVAAANHTDEDYAVLLASANPTFEKATRVQSLTSASAGLNYNILVSGTPLTRTPVPEVDKIDGYSLAPFAPTLLKALLATGNDVVLSWTRRDRLGTNFVTDPQVLSETAEKYDVEIMNGTTVVRTLTDLTVPSYTYTSANQTADGFTPPMAAIKFRVYQKGELGRGFPREETVNVN